jgi:phage host-nuclease inhibitor protein Gam
MKVKLRIESPDKAAVEIEKNINSIMEIVDENINEMFIRIEDEIIDNIYDIDPDAHIDETMGIIKSFIVENIDNIKSINRQQKIEYENDIIDLHGDYEHKISTLEDYYEKKIKALEAHIESLTDNIEDYMY